MTPTALLTTQQTLDLLATLDGWGLAEDHRALVKTFAFANFNAAFGWMTRVALAAEKMTTIPIGTMSTAKSMSACRAMMSAELPSAMSN